MTSIAIVAAAIPEALSKGSGSETMVPMAIALIGGVILSTILTLFCYSVRLRAVFPGMKARINPGLKRNNAKNRERINSIRVKILSVIFLAIFLIASLLGYLSYEFSKNRIVFMLGEVIKGVAATTANFIDADDLARDTEKF